LRIQAYDRNSIPWRIVAPPPFEKCESTLQLAEQLGVGSRDLGQIEVLGTPIAKARFDFGNAPAG
jgi:hypothetical protein